MIGLTREKQLSISFPKSFFTGKQNRFWKKRAFIGNRTGGREPETGWCSALWLFIKRIDFFVIPDSLGSPSEVTGLCILSISMSLFYTFDSHLPISLIFNFKVLPITLIGLLPNKLSQLIEMDFSFARYPAFITQDVKTTRGTLQGLQIVRISRSEWFGRSQEALHPVTGHAPVRWHGPVWLSHASLALIFKVTYSAQANPNAFLIILCRRSDGLGRWWGDFPCVPQRQIFLHRHHVV